tara:strand:+ start:2190 stop:2444 length:255 start_codon:yes stop_codon:yes gene_type:complete
MGLLYSMLQAYSHLSNLDDPTHDELDNLRIMGGELSRMARAADRMNESSDFIERVYELAFGDNAINRGFTDEEVLERLTEALGL